MTPSTDASLVSVVIPTLCRYDALKTTLECLAASAYSNMEILIVDQTPGGPPAGFPVSRENARWLRQEKMSLPLARNYGIRESRGALILFLDDDVTFGPEFVGEHVTAHLARPEAAAIAGRIKLVEPDFWMAQEKVAFLDARTAKFHANFDKSAAGPVDFFCGCNFSLKREAAEVVGGFDETFQGNALYEEIDYCLRLRKKGGLIYFHPAAMLTHLRETAGGCRKDAGARYHFAKFYNTAYFYAKHLFDGNPFPFLGAMKNEIEFFTRKEKGHAFLRAALYVLALKLGGLRGLLKRLLPI